LTLYLIWDILLLYCQVKLNYLWQTLTSFNDFPVDKIVKSLWSSDRLATVSEKCIHSVAWPNLSRDRY